MNRILQENIFKRRGATTVMHYPSFQDVYRSAPICPASGVFQSFPQPFRMGFDANMVFHPSYQKIGTMAQDPVVDGVIVGKADGRYARGQSLLGLVLARVGKERFIAPFYADAKARAGYVDRKIATKTGAGSLSELGLEDAINNIRESERIGGTIIDTALVAIPILAGCFAVAEQVGITDLVRYLTGMETITQAGLLTAGGVAWTNHHKHRNAYEANYRNLAHLVTLGKEQKQTEQKK